MALINDLKKTYDSGIKNGIFILTHSIHKASAPGQKKANLCVCGDYSVTVNHQLETHRHPIPSPDNLMQRLSGGYYFTKINLADAYNQVKLSAESQRAHQRVLLQTCLPVGISFAPGYFQEIMDHLTCDLQGIAVYLDDILVSGENTNEDLQNLRAIFNVCKKGLQWKLEKYDFAQSLVEYLGHTLSR